MGCGGSKEGGDEGGPKHRGAHDVEHASWQVEEVYPPKANEFALITDGAFTIAEIYKVEPAARG